MKQSTVSTLVRIRIVLWVVVAIAAIGAMTLYATKPQPGGPNGKPFTLEATDGSSFTEASFKGTPTLLLFGYTFCPDVCPTSLAEMAGYREQLGLGPDRLRIVFASVDPERDTLGVLKTYLGGFGTPMLGLTGSPAQVDAARAAFGIYAKKADDDGKGHYSVEHTATVFLMDRDGRYQASIPYGEDPAEALAKVRKLVAG